MVEIGLVQITVKDVEIGIARRKIQKEEIGRIK